MDQRLGRRRIRLLGEQRAWVPMTAHHDAETGADPFAAISVVHQVRRCLYAFEAEKLVEPVR